MRAVRRLGVDMAAAQTRDFRSADERDPYLAVCEALRKSIEIVLATDEGRELTRSVRAFMAGLWFTAGHSRMYDVAALEQIAGVARIPGEVDGRGEFLGKHTADALHRWHDEGALIWTPSTTRGRASWVGLPGSAVHQLPLTNVVRGATKERPTPVSGSPKAPLGEPLAPAGLSLVAPPPSRDTSRAAAAGDDAVQDSSVAGDVLAGLDELGVSDNRIRGRALDEPERALAWIELALERAVHNPAGYFVKLFKTGEWPAPRRRGAKSELDRDVERLWGVLTNAEASAIVDHCVKCSKPFETTSDADEAYCPQCRASGTT
jgi:hypothetical protein